MTRHGQSTQPPHDVPDEHRLGSSNLAVVLRVLGHRHRLRQRDRWTPQQLQAYQAQALRQLRDHAYAHSPFYRRFHAGRIDRPLHELPVLTKALVMEHFNQLVTDPAVRLTGVEAHLAALHGNEQFRGRYWVAATSGTTGRRGIFLWDLDEWVTVLASYNRSLDWAGATAGLTRRLRMAVVSSTTPWHQSARVGATVRSPWVQTLRIDSGDPLEHILGQLDRFQPQVLVGYASMLRLLASEKLATAVPAAPGGVRGDPDALASRDHPLEGAIPTQRASRADPGGGRENQLNRRPRMSPPAAAISPNWYSKSMAARSGGPSSSGGRKPLARNAMA
jgi:hypothetical protein